MRVFLGILIGICLTIGAAYVYDSVTSGPAAPGSEPAARKPMVNWDVVGKDWHDFTHGVSQAWERIRK